VVKRKHCAVKAPTDVGRKVGVMNLAVVAMRGKGARATRRERSEEKFRDAPTLE
jgi:hypothetical protein